SIFCCGVSLSCCDNACNFAAGSVVWPGAAGPKVRNAKKHAADVRSVKCFFVVCIAALSKAIDGASRISLCCHGAHLPLRPRLRNPNTEVVGRQDKHERQLDYL